MRILPAAAAYFALVFAAGFVLGTIRVLVVVPRLGVRTGELLELPLMVAVTYGAARLIDRRFALPGSPGPRLGTGFIALAFLLLAELGLAVLLLRTPVRQVFTGRDPVSGPAYLASLILFALMPLLIRPRPSRAPE